MPALIKPSDEFRHAAPAVASIGDTPQLELALLRRGIGGRDTDLECCGSCNRHLLIGERIYEYDAGEILCALCAERERRQPERSHVVRTPAFGNSIRVLDRRARRVA